ncbi:MAG: alpha/beta hydrolase [Chitinophagales bacterium]
MIHKTTYNNGDDVFYKTLGKGPLLYLVHGFCADSRIWNELLVQLSENFTLVLPDLPGYGKSPLPNEKLTIEVFADAIEAIISNEAHSNICIAGHSMGGYVLCELLSRKIPGFKKGIIIHAHPFADDSEKITERKKANRLIEKHGHHLFVKELYKKLFAPANRLSDHEHKFNEIISDLKTETIVQSNLAMIMRKDHRLTLANSAIPLQFIIGEDDRLIELEKSISQTYLAPISDVQILANTGHLSMIENSAKLVEYIQSFTMLDL